MWPQSLDDLEDSDDSFDIWDTLISLNRPHETKERHNTRVHIRIQRPADIVA